MNESKKQDTELKRSINVKFQLDVDDEDEELGIDDEGLWRRQRIHHLKCEQIFGKVLKVTMILLTSLCWWLYDDDWFEMLVAESLPQVCLRLFSLLYPNINEAVLKAEK